MSDNFPHVLIVSDSPISLAHGTGTLVWRHFSGYPLEKLFNAYCTEAGQPAWAMASRFCGTYAPFRPLDVVPGVTLRIYNSAVFRLGFKRLVYQRPIVFRPNGDEVLSMGFQPEVIYSVVYSNTGLALVDHLCACLTPTIPVVQYFLDYQMALGFGRERYLRRVLARADEVWALTDEIAEALLPVAASIGKKVQVQPGFHIELPTRWKQHHRPVSSGDFNCVIIGNFWQATMAQVVKRVWRRVQKARPGLRPIQWFCHPQSVRHTCDTLGDVEPEIQPVGFFTGEELLDRLINADLAIVPFNLRRRPENDYARYSLPSRLTELLSVGLPVFCIAGEQTPLARYITEHRLGMICDAEDEERLANRLVAFIRNQEERVAAGVRTRQFAEKEFALGPFQQALYTKLAKLAGEVHDRGRLL